MEKETEHNFLSAGTIPWFAALLFYAVMVGAAVRVGEPQGIGVYHGGALIALLVTTAAILLRNERQTRSKALRQK